MLSFSRTACFNTNNAFATLVLNLLHHHETINNLLPLAMSTSMMKFSWRLLKRCQQPTTTQPVLQRRLLSIPSAGASGFEKVGVIGLGLMGHGICQVAAAAGAHSSHSVVAYEPDEKFLNSGKDRIAGSLEKLVSKGKISQDDADKTMGSIQFTTDMSDLKDMDLIVEAVVEKMDLKKDIYTNLGQICEEKTIFASNTSGLSITEMAAFSGRTDRFLGVHFFNPVQIMKLVEVIKTEQTDQKVFDRCYSWVQEIDKVPVSCGDTPGFIVNRLLVPSFIQAMLMVDRKDATVKDIDLSMQLGAGHPMGPLHLSDYIGLDTIMSVMESWCEKYPDEPAFLVPQCIKDKVAAGHTGRKAGKGFYHWDGDKRGHPV